MNIALWIIQAILAIKLISAAFSHSLGTAKPEMQQATSRMGSLAKPLHIGTACLTLLCSVGLILPALPGIPGWVLLLAAGASIFILALSIPLHIQAREKPKVFVSIVLMLFAAVILYGRIALAPV